MLVNTSANWQFLSPLQQQELVNQEFLHFYEMDNSKGIKNLLTHPYLDVNYREGIFLTRAAQVGDMKMLETLFEKGATQGLDYALRAAASEGHGDCVEYLVGKGANPQSLLGSTAYSQYDDIRELLDQLIQESTSKAK